MRKKTGSADQVAPPKTSSLRRTANSSFLCRGPVNRSSAICVGVKRCKACTHDGSAPARRRPGGAARRAYPSPYLSGLRENGCSFSFLFEEGADRALISRWFERVNEIAKPFGENFRPKFPVMS